MWRRSDDSGETVVCIACGDEPSREQAREYDKEGNRWDRQDKEFEYLCKDCFGELSHQPRRGLEETLEEACVPGQSPKTFVRRYLAVAAERADEEASD